MNPQNLTYLMCFSPLQLLSLLILRMILSLVSGGLFKLAVHTFDVTNSLIASLVSSVIRYELPWWHSGKDLNPHDYIYGGFPGGGPVQKIQVRSLDWEDPLEEEMAGYSNILAWEIPWIEGPDGLQSTWSQKSQTQLSD